jgi:S-adenosylmethionine uptake transporter
MPSPADTDPVRLPSGPLGPVLALMAFGLYATHDVLIRILGETYNIVQIVFYMSLLGFPMLVLLQLRDPAPVSLRANNPGLMALRTTAVMISGAAAFYAFTVLPLAQVYSVLFATPLLITLLAIPFLGEKVGIHRGLAVVVGLIGVLVVLRPGGGEFSLGHLAALLAAVSAAVNSVVVRKIGRQESNLVMLIYPLLANVAVMGVAMIPVYVPMTLADLGVVAVIAILALVAMNLSIAAYRLADAALVAPMQYSQILWATLYGALLFNETPTLFTAAGSALIIGSGLYILFRESRRNVSANTPVLRSRLRDGGQA